MKKVCLIFPGQGSQYIGMCQDIYNHHNSARSMINEISDYAKMDVPNLLFKSTESDLQDTRNAQIAIMSASVMLYHSLLEGCGDNFLQNNGLELVCTAGHSLGEYSALYVAGVISLEQTSKLLQKRSLLMAAGNTNAGMMAIIGADVELISKIIDEVKMQKQDMVLEIANYNSIGQVVISGHVDAIETFSEIAKNNNIKKCIKLNVSNAFHSSLMQEAQNGMRTIIESEDFLNPSCPVIQNYTAQFTTDVKTIKENLVMQISNQVKWVETVQNAIQHGVELFIEIGPKNVLTGLIKRIDANVQTMNIEKLEDIENFQENIKKLFNK